MFPKLRLTDSHRKDWLPEPQPPPPKPTMYPLPELNSHRLNSYAALDSIGVLLPHIKRNVKESKTDSVRDLIDRISINNKLLYFELSAVRLQSLVRRFLARLRVLRVRRRFELFMRVTQACAERYLEEFVLASAFEISIEFYRKQMKFQMMRDSVDRQLVAVSNGLLNEIVDELVSEATNDTITEAIEAVLTMRGRSAAMIESEMQAEQDRLDKLNKAALKPPNPILVLLDTFVQDQIVPWIRGVVFESVEEEVAEYVLHKNSTMLYDILFKECVLDELIDVIQIYHAQDPMVSVPMILQLVHTRQRLFHPKRWVDFI